jgi:drug/metabolite transporter (DMT)-like permease
VSSRGKVSSEGRAAPPDRATLLAFALLVLIGGSNAVAVRFSNLELPPFWGAGIRFVAAALIFWVIVLVRRIALPKGRALIGVLLYGALAIGISYAFLYWGLVRIQAGFTMVVGAFVPLLTLLMALIHGLEQFRRRAFAGALIAIAGIMLVVGDRLGTDVPLASLLALVASVVCIAEGSVIYKLLPKTDPLAVNALSVSTGALMLLGLSVAVGESWTLPTALNTWASFAYLVVFGSVTLFYLYLFVLSRWTASATNYSFLLFPVVTVTMAAWLLGEEATISLIIGGAIVLVGVWVGAFGGPGRESASESVSVPVTPQD